METIHGYMVVAEGGQYSDHYHHNERFYLDRSEAETYIESKREAFREWNRFVALCPNNPSYDPKSYSAWKIEILKICEDNFPQFIEQVKCLSWLNKEDEKTDLQIEEIDIPVGSRLYRILKEAE